MARSVACLLSAGVTPHDTDLFMSLLQLHTTNTTQQQQKTQPHREGSILIIPMSPPHLDPIRHTHLRGEGWTLACLAWARLLCDHPLCSAQAVWRGEGHGKGSEYPMSSASQPPHYLRYWWWHLCALSLSPSRSLFPDLPRTVIKIWWAHNL